MHFQHCGNTLFGKTKIITLKMPRNTKNAPVNGMWQHEGLFIRQLYITDNETPIPTARFVIRLSFVTDNEYRRSTRIGTWSGQRVSLSVMWTDNETLVCSDLMQTKDLTWYFDNLPESGNFATLDHSSLLSSPLWLVWKKNFITIITQWATLSYVELFPMNLSKRQALAWLKLLTWQKHCDTTI